MENYEEDYEEPTLEEAICDADYSEIYTLFWKISCEGKFDAEKMLNKLFGNKPLNTYSLKLASACGYDNYLVLHRENGNAYVSDWFTISEQYWKDHCLVGERYRKHIGIYGDNYDRVYKPYTLIKEWFEERFDRA